MANLNPLKPANKFNVGAKLFHVHKLTSFKIGVVCFCFHCCKKKDQNVAPVIFFTEEWELNIQSCCRNCLPYACIQSLAPKREGKNKLVSIG